MTEPEIREAYIRIAERRASLDARVQAMTASELELRRGVQESVLVVPLFAGPNLVDPTQLRELGRALQDGVLAGFSMKSRIGGLALDYDGYRLIEGGPPETAGSYLAILRSGVVHYSVNNAFRAEGRVDSFLSTPAIDRPSFGHRLGGASALRLLGHGSHSLSAARMAPVVR